MSFKLKHFKKNNKQTQIEIQFIFSLYKKIQQIPSKVSLIVGYKKPFYLMVRVLCDFM